MENWKNIDGHPKYQVSDQGRIKNIESGEILVFNQHPNGYLQKSLDGKNYLIHRLVAKYFVPNPDNKPCVDHIDGNKKSNIANNLRWVTIGENNSNPNTRWKNVRTEIPVERTGKVMDIFIKSYPNIQTAAADVGCVESNIRKVINHEFGRFTAGGYMWRKKS